MKPAVCVRKPRIKSASRFVSVIRRSDPEKCVLRIYSKLSVRYCCWLWFHLTKNKQPVLIRKEGWSWRVLESTQCTKSTRLRTRLLESILEPGYFSSRYTCTRYPAFPPSTLFHPRAEGSPVY